MKIFRKPCVFALLSAVIFFATSQSHAGESLKGPGSWVSQGVCLARGILGSCSARDARQGPSRYRLGLGSVYQGPGGIFKLASKFIDDFKVAEIGKVRVKLSLKFI